MRKRIISLSAVGALAIALQVFLAGTALAHHPEIEAEAVCIIPTCEVVINYTSTAWETTRPLASRDNPQIDILVDGVVVASGAYTAPDYSFSGSVPKPAGKGEGDAVTVTAVAVGDWGNGEPGGESRSTVVILPSEDCCPECEVELDKTCCVPPLPSGLECEAKIAATTLRYIGPDDLNADVVFSGKAEGDASYLGVDLISGVTVLTDPGQNGFTVDGRPGDLGSKLTVTIDGVAEIIHTSCSAPYIVGEPAPLDGQTGPGVEKGDPSPNWLVERFVDKEGRESSPPDPGPSGGTACQPAEFFDMCDVALGGTVEYQYTVTSPLSNLWPITVSVEDDPDVDDGDPTTVLIGSEILDPGEEVTFFAARTLSQETTNEATVTATTDGLVCDATDEVTVEIIPEPFNCKDAKPITSLTLIWEGTSGTLVTVEDGQQFVVGNGEEVTFSVAGLGNDVDVEMAGVGFSRFHVSCSDKDMNGPEDCGKPQGNGKDKKKKKKKSQSQLLDLWTFAGMAGDQALVCP